MFFLNVYTVFFSMLSLNLFSQEKIVSFGDEWKYYFEKKAPEVGWQNSNRITSVWETGVSGLGYGDKRVKTNIKGEVDVRKEGIAAYFTKTFIIEDPFKYLMYQLKLQKDDGAVIYLNGNEIKRIDMPSGKIGHNTWSSKAVKTQEREDELFSIIIAPEELNIGKNVLSASVHQCSVHSSDLVFNLEMDGYNDIETLIVLEKERAINNLHTKIKMKDLEYSQELEQKSLEKELISQKNGSYKVYLLIVFVLVLSSIVVLSQIYKNFTNRNLELITNNGSLRNQNQMKSSEMINISLNSLNSQQLLKVVKKDLEDSLGVESYTILKKSINRIVNNISYNIDSTEEWENLKKHFNVVHSGYVDKLSELHPLLTDVELRHCIFIKLHMQTKEIADVLHIDPRSVQSSRYRIKKKMGLEENVSLKEYLIGIS